MQFDACIIWGNLTCFRSEALYEASFARRSVFHLLLCFEPPHSPWLYNLISSIGIKIWRCNSMHVLYEGIWHVSWACVSFIFGCPFLSRTFMLLLIRRRAAETVACSQWNLMKLRLRHNQLLVSMDVPACRKQVMCSSSPMIKRIFKRMRFCDDKNLIWLLAYEGGKTADSLWFSFLVYFPHLI